jgi:hypothetical protein
MEWAVFIVRLWQAYPQRHLSRMGWRLEPNAAPCAGVEGAATWREMEQEAVSTVMP